MINDVLEKSLEFDKHLLKIPVKEIKDPVVSLKLQAKESNSSLVFGNNPNLKPFVRRKVALALLKVARDLKKMGYLLKIESAYRSLNTQKKLFRGYFAKLAKENPTFSKQKLLEMTNIYVAGIPILGAHTSAAAVDVVLLNDKNQEVDMGTKYLEMSEKTVTNYPNLPEKVKQNRKLLSKIMAQNGMINYPFEWWHFSMGDVCAAYINKEKQAKFGPVVYSKNTSKYMKLEDCYSYFKV